MSVISGCLLKWDLVLFDRVVMRTRKALSVRLLRSISSSANGHAYPFVLLLLTLTRGENWQKIMASFFLAFALEVSTYLILEHSIRRCRPVHTVPGCEQLVIPPNTFSFPSGHTAAAFVAAVLIGHWFPIITLPVYFWASLVGFSRLYLGVHFPADVLAGATLGILCAHVGLLVCSAV